MSTLPSKREFLSLNTNPKTGEPFAKFPSRGRFSAEAEAFAAANADKWTEAVAVPAKPKAEKPKGVSLAKAPQKPVTAETGAQRAAAALARREAKQADTGEVAARPTPLLMPKRRPENTGFTVVGGTLIRQSQCGNCREGVARCACKEGPRAYKWLEKEVGGPLSLVLDKPDALASV